MTLESALNSANVLVEKPATVAKVAKRIAAQLDGDVSSQDLRELASVLDRAGWEADGAGLTGVLLGFMVGLEVGAGVKPPKLTQCQGCSKKLLDSDWCTALCRRRASDHLKWAARTANSGSLAA